MKKWQKRLMQLVNKLGFGTKMEAGQLTADEQKQLFTEYEATYKVSFAADREADEDDDETYPNVLSPEDQQQLASIFGGDKTPKTAKEAVPALTDKVKEQKEQIEILGKKPEVKDPVEVVKATVTNAQVMGKVLGRTNHSTTHLFGIEHPMFSLEKFYNQVTVDKKPVIENATIEQRNMFRDDFNTFAEQFKARAKELQDKNMMESLDFNQMISGNGPIDYADLMDTAGEYIVRRTDLIIAYLRTLPNVDHIFPMVSNVQNKEIVPGAHFGELSQGYRPGKHFKGGVKLSAEIYKVDDIQFKFLFSDLIELEKQYIGDMNREGANVIKWHWMEWIMVYFGAILISENNRRRVVGYRVPLQKVTANPAMLAADGGLRGIERTEEELKVLPFLDLGVYTDGTMVEYSQVFWDRVYQLLQGMEGMKLHANGKHKPWYLRDFRARFGKDNDFNGVKDGLIDVAPENIVWVPNMDMNNYKMWITIPGNVENYEDKPLEMLGFYFERDWESIGVMSRWKGGAGLRKAGVKAKKLEDHLESDRTLQWIFTNFPATELDPDATKFNGKENTLFVTGENTAATVLSDIEGYQADRIYKVVCGSLTNKTTVSKAGKFAKIESDFVPVKVGDWIKFRAELEDYEEEIDGETVTLTRPTGNFLEVERKLY